MKKEPNQLPKLLVQYLAQLEVLWKFMKTCQTNISFGGMEDYTITVPLRPWAPFLALFWL